jgi:membrane protein DedA with SNARE-associated domain
LVLPTDFHRFRKARGRDRMITALLTTAAAHPVVQSAAIIGSTFILEDATTVLVGMLAASGVVSPLLALVALWIGIAAGDLGLYGLGRLAVTHRWARRYAATRRAERLRLWLGPRLGSTVFAVRFLPGLRFAVYTGCGFLRLSFARFAAAVAIATFFWTTLLFGLAYAFGDWAATVIGPWRWPLSIGIALLVVAASRFAMRERIARLEAE